MDPLPIDGLLPALKATMREGVSAVLQAPPGSGKTTRVPLALLGESWVGNRSILILEPRRLAARAAAGRMADLLGEPVGQTVGYRIRFEAKVSAATRIEVLTEGMLTRRLQADPGLEGVAMVIFDEFHERHLQADLALALCVDCRRVLRDDLRVLVMSATLDGEAVASVLDDAPVLTAEGRQYPVRVRYAGADMREGIPEETARAVLAAIAREAGDVLVFLPGGAEIRQTQQRLESALCGQAFDVLPLYGDLPWEAQDRAMRPAATGRRKVILATSIAETSVTIEGIGIVIDTGFVRVPEYDSGNGLTRLATHRISHASAEQRAGRAGRLGPGVCHRLWTMVTHRGLTAAPIPEIRTVDLTSLALELAQWGVRDAGSLTWIDPPSAGSLARARDVLTELGALDEQGAMTETGRRMASVPLHPRLAYMVMQGDAAGLGPTACDLAAVLSERDVFAGVAKRSCDLLERMGAMRVFDARGEEGARAVGADPGTCRRVERASRQYRRWLRNPATPRTATDEEVGVLLASAYPDRIARQRSPGGVRYVLASGRGARLPVAEQRLRTEWLVAADVDAGETEGQIRLAAPLDLDVLRRTTPSVAKSTTHIEWNEELECVSSQTEERIGSLVVGTRRLSRPDPERVYGAMLDGIRRLGISALPWTSETRDWQARVLSMREWFPDEEWPDVSDASLLARLSMWLVPFLGGIASREHLTRLDLPGALRTCLDWTLQRRLDEGAPTHLVVPSGSRLRLAYRPGESPVLAVKLQELFGVGETPRVAWGRIAVTLHLLSPARRPIQVTQDLRGFWDRTYPEVRKILRGRYPKHPWPDDPWTARPTARAKPNRSTRREG